MRELTLAALAAVSLGGAAAAEDRILRMATIAPSLGQAITMATFANVVTDNLDGLSIEVSGGGAATLHMMEVARGNLDLSMTSPVVYNLMAGGKAMYAGEPEAPELAKNLQLLMWFPYGQYHFTVRADSDIQTLDDLEGTTVFLGPQGGGAYNAAKGWVEATTGLVANEDYDAIKANWQTGFQAFLDGKIDVYVNGCLDPCGQFIQFTETEELRFLGPESHEGESVEKFLGQWRYRAEVPADMYQGQANDGPVMSFDTAVGIAVRADLDEDTVYALTKAFWDNIEQITSEAPWAEALDVSFAASKRGLMELHPGAAAYYREAGVIE
ncbi:MAG: TAXI family TRAP transporter solute-binding subunit [Rhodobacter sp.]|nr:TAXI family TRAP transporter solute-binding subunit [Rhodobacter sp.]MCY4168209.1 TAXI family TRAP transporter solute-binding subunit [Rhodobacter sp.]MCY4240862.1 TAXI family TRAP transporter solute-binding subunit [Rhodobacter sp.]